MLLSADQVLSAVFYGTTSTVMAFLNKAVLSSYSFGYPLTLLIVQMLLSIACVELLRITNTVKLLKYNLSRGISFWMPSVCSTAHSVVSLLALKGLNIPMYAAIKRCTPLMNLILAVVILHKPVPSALVTFSILLITVGCLVAGFGDLSFNSTAYVLGGLSVLIQGTYQTLIQKAAEEDFSSIEILQLNSYNSLFLVLGGYFLTSEPEGVVSYNGKTDPGFLACFFLVISVGVIHNYSLFLCTSHNSALTTSLIGVLKSVLQTVVGFFTFGGVLYHPVNILGLTLNTFGGVVYTYAKFNEKKPKVKEEPIVSNGHTTVLVA